jgi:LuxR family maltose regulon positive regulatory protein
LQSSGQYERAVEFAHRQLHASGWEVHALNLRVLLALANIHHEMADLPALQDLLPTWQGLLRRSGLELSAGWLHYTEGWLHYQRNELDAAEAAFRRLTDRAWTAHGRSVVEAFTGLVLTDLARGDLDAARGHIAVLREYLLDSGLVPLLNVAESLGQRVALAASAAAASAAAAGAGGNGAAAAAGAAGGVFEWRPDASTPAIPREAWEQPVLTHARTLLAAGAPEALAHAAGLLAGCRARAHTRHSNRRLIEISGLQALALAGMGDSDAALAVLQEGVELAASVGALRLLADGGPGLAPLLRRLQAQGVAPYYLQKVLAVIDAAPAGGERLHPPLEPPAGQPHGAPPAAPGKDGATPGPVALPAKDGPAPAALPAPRPSGEPADREILLVELLTNREIDVLLLLAERLSDKEIADRLVLAPVTVKKHAQRIYGKLGVHGRRAAVARARHLGLI